MASAPSQDAAPAGLLEAVEETTPAMLAIWSPRDLAARTWD